METQLPSIGNLYYMKDSDMYTKHVLIGDNEKIGVSINYSTAGKIVTAEVRRACPNPLTTTKENLTNWYQAEGYKECTKVEFLEALNNANAFNRPHFIHAGEMMRNSEMSFGPGAYTFPNNSGR